jgi:hypothetical protein
VTSKLSALSRHEVLAAERRLLRALGRSASPLAKPLPVTNKLQKSVARVLAKTDAPQTTVSLPPVETPPTPIVR